MPSADVARLRARPRVTFDGTVTANVPALPRRARVTMARQRLFVAVFPGPEVVDDLVRVVEPLRVEAPELRWTLPDQWHVTLSFLPAVPAEDVDGFVSALERIATATPPLRLMLTGVGAFPRADRARVVWAGVGGDVERLHTLADGCRTAAADRGLDVSRGTFRPHLTLARARRAPVRARLSLAAMAGYEGPPWTADTLVVVRSHLGAGEAGRPRYEVCRSLPLSG